MTEKWRRPQFALVVADRNETYTELTVPKLLLKKKKLTGNVDGHFLCLHINMTVLLRTTFLVFL